MLCFKCGRYDECGSRVTSTSHYDTTAQPEVALREIPPVSDSGPGIQVAPPELNGPDSL